MKYSRRAISIHNLDRHVFVIYLTSYALPLLQRLSFNCWWPSVTSETSAARDSIECFIHRSVVNCESFRVSTSSSSTISSPLSWSDSLRFSQENCKIRSSCILLLVYRYSSLPMYRSCRANGCYFESVAINISFHHLKCSSRLLLSFDRSIEISLDPRGSLTRSTIDIQRAENNNSRIVVLFLLLAFCLCWANKLVCARFQTYSS